MYEKRAPPYQEKKVQSMNDSSRLYSFSNIVHKLFETHHVSKRIGPPHPVASLCTTTPTMYNYTFQQIILYAYKTMLSIHAS